MTVVTFDSKGNEYESYFGVTKITYDEKLKRFYLSGAYIETMCSIQEVEIKVKN